MKILRKWRDSVRPGRIFKASPDCLTVSWDDNKINEELKSGYMLQAICNFFDEIGFYKDGGNFFDPDKVKPTYENINPKYYSV